MCYPEEALSHFLAPPLLYNYLNLQHLVYTTTSMYNVYTTLVYTKLGFTTP